MNMSASTAPDTAADTASNTTWLLAFDGTWANRVTGNRGTIIQTLVRCIDRSVGNVYVWYCKGVGTADALLDRHIGGGTGRGVQHNVIEAFLFLVDNYRKGDKIVLVGYSRGSATTRALACLIDRIGILDAKAIQDKGQDLYELCRDLYKKYIRGELRKPRVASHLRNKYNSHADVRIAAVCCFDTVTSIGIPTTGLFKVTKLFRSLSRRHNYLEFDPIFVVDHLCHAVALHEKRASYDVELMRVRQGDSTVLKQVYFLGNHGDLGWDSQYGGLVDIPLAWMMQQLHDCAGIAFNERELQNRFPAAKSKPLLVTPDTPVDIVHEPIRKCSLKMQVLTGHKTRVPGSSFGDRWVTREQIHPTVRLRGYGATESSDAVPQHGLEEKHDGVFHWVRGPRRMGTASSDSSMEPQSIPETELGELEERLLGIKLVNGRDRAFRDRN